ncbi:alpha/beta hydrolase [Rhodococcus sp. ABRD24]|uniref:alpha/beta fold hydrolase n=1 Tax=Rhodococcus sp. ABRD24 TaxID=2507582 RepID=UPI00103DBE56|nr:alpha/beta hydrolase [Rhodococcus sp. ABRD24]QBJ95341.1 alpha/beta hydrolase [Rhodococcus sp. ABRD24]
MTAALTVDHEMRELTVTGAQGCALLVRDFGPREAPAIVLVHGLGADGLVWRHQIDALAGEHRVIVVDLRGHGRSEAPDDASYSSSSTWAADLAAVLAQTGVFRPVVIGWSYGGLVVADYVAAHGTDSIAGIALVAPLRKVGTDEAFGLLAEVFLGVVPGLLADTLPESVAAARTFVDLIPGVPWTDAERYERLGAALTVSPAVRAAMFARECDTDSVWVDVKVPMLLAYGTADQIVKQESTMSLAELLPDATVSVYDSAGHSPFTDAADRFNRDVRDLVARTR